MDSTFFRDVLDHVNDGVYFVDLERRSFIGMKAPFA